MCGGANGSIRMPEELKHGGNAGLSKAVRFLEVSDAVDMVAIVTIVVDVSEVDMDVIRVVVVHTVTIDMVAV